VNYVLGQIMTMSRFGIRNIVSNYLLSINSPIFLTIFSHSMEFRYNRIGTCHTYHPRVSKFLERGGKVLCPTHLTG
jgi:hypothetical protein